MKRALVAALAVALCVGLSRPGSAHEIKAGAHARPERYVPVLEVGSIVPDVRLVDQSKRPFSFRKLGGKAAVVAFIYTRCNDPKMCPLVSAKFARLQRMIDPSTTRLVELTLDPEFDTPAVLTRYGAAFGALRDRWTFATGSDDDVDELSRRMGIVSKPGGGGVLEHSEALVVLDSDGRITDRIDGNLWTPEQALSLAQRALRERTSPFVRLSLALSSGIAAICGGGVSGITLAAAIAIFLGIAAALGFAFFRTFRAALR
ncbi:MAG TPA: SCO family protein [Candidatus Binatia bacterium]|nr:SCO family protein [Candidatus Binatia bacterium]